MSTRPTLSKSCRWLISEQEGGLRPQIKYSSMVVDGNQPSMHHVHRLSSARLPTGAEQTISTPNVTIDNLFRFNRWVKLTEAGAFGL